MKWLNRIGLGFLFFIQLSLIGFAQSGIITTYVGSQLPVNGALAVTSAIDALVSVAPDGAGGFYVASGRQNRVYRIGVDGRLSLAAGNGTNGFSGDGGPAALAQLYNPTGLAVDAAGNLFIADDGNNRVRKVTPGGTISTVAGNGTRGFSGDGGPATAAQLRGLYGLAVDAAGNLFIADSGNNRVRKVTPGAVISTVAGGGIAGLGDDGPATAALLNGPYGLAVDGAGNLFIADYYYQRVRKVTPGGVISTVAGNGAYGFSGDGGQATSAQLGYPYGVALDTAGNLFIADSGNNRVRKVTPGGVISTVAGNGNGGFSGDGGLATSAQLNIPSGVTADTAGNLLVADSGNNRVRKVAPGGVISTVAGNGSYGFSGDGGPANSAQLNGPYGVALDTAGNLFIADSANHSVRKVTPGGTISTVAGNGTFGFSGDGGPAISAQLNFPFGVALDTAGNLFIADIYSGRVRKVTPGGVISTLAGNGTPGFGGDGGPATSAQLRGPRGLALDRAGNLFIADTLDGRVRKVTPGGAISTVAGNGTDGFSGDGGPATSAQLKSLWGLAVDTAGNLFIADSGNNRIRRVTPGGVISTVAGNGVAGFSGDGGPATFAQLYGPSGLALDSAGNQFIADPGNDRVRKVTLDATASTFYPQVAVGGGFSTTFMLGNTGATAISGNLIFTDQQGNPFVVRSSDFGPESSFPVSIPPGGTSFLTVYPISPNDPAKSGWAKTSTTGGLPSGVATFQLVSGGVLQTATGVLASQPVKFATIPVDDDLSQNRFTAYALANPNNQSLVVKLGLVDQIGNLVDDTVSITLGPGQQIARFLFQDVNRPQFKGSIVLRGQGGGTFVAVALIQNQQIYMVIPVTPEKAPNIPD